MCKPLNQFYGRGILYFLKEASSSWGRTLEITTNNSIDDGDDGNMGMDKDKDRDKDKELELELDLDLDLDLEMGLKLKLHVFGYDIDMKKDTFVSIHSYYS